MIMKFLCSVSLLFFSFAGFANNSNIQSVTLKVNTNLAKVNLEVACVQYMNTEGEIDSSTLFFSADSYKVVRTLESAGLTSKRLVKAKCGEDLVDVTVMTFSSADKVTKEIEAQGGFKTSTVGFYNYQEAKSAFDLSLSQTLDNL